MVCHACKPWRAELADHQVTLIPAQLFIDKYFQVMAINKYADTSAPAMGTPAVTARTARPCIIWAVVRGEEGSAPETEASLGARAGTTR